MIKGIALAVRKPGLSDDTFYRHWREIHGPLPRAIKNLRGYVQCHRKPTAVPGFDDVPLDGLAEIWFDDLTALMNLPNDPDYINGAQRDEPNFLDMTKLVFLATREHVLIDEIKIHKTTSLTKAIFLLRRRPDLSVAEFQDYWLNQHAPQIPRDAGVLRYVQSHTVPESYVDSAPPYDGVAELSFADDTAFLNYWNSPRIQAIFAADAPRFLDGAGCTAFLAQENRVIWPIG
jgi:uncharacterized protein (TIGR02118 family)